MSTYVLNKKLLCALFAVSAALSTHVVATEVAPLSEQLQSQAVQGNETAINSINACAQNNNDDCQGFLGYLYLTGKGLLQNNQLAYLWLEKSAYYNNPKAQFYLANMYEHRLIPNGSAMQAVKWYERSANLGYAKAATNLGDLYYSTQFNQELELTPTQSTLKAMDWYSFAAKLNDPKALAWFKTEADKNIALVQLGLSDLYQQGIGVTKDEAQAQYWLLKAQDNGGEDASASMGEYYLSKQQYSNAKIYFEKATKLGFAPAYTKIGYLYEKGWGVEQNYGLAIDWYKKAAAAGDATAFYNLGVLYGTGRGVDKNYVAAYKCLKTATQMNVAGAAKQLDDLKKVMWKTQIDKAEAELLQAEPPAEAKQDK